MAEKRVQRRLAAILAADVVGYSRMMEADEAGTLVALKTLLQDLFVPKTKQYSGRIFKTTGDGALVEFTSAVDAVRNAHAAPGETPGAGAAAGARADDNDFGLDRGHQRARSGDAA